MGTHHEVERTYAPGPDAEVPDLCELPGVADVGEPRVDELVATYFDTHDLGLLRAGVTLRRRTGGADEGWHLKVPAGPGREETQLPLARSAETPPDELLEAVQGWVRGAPVAVVATVATRRTAYPLLGETRELLAELADDQVIGTRADGKVVFWREWELELGGGDLDLLDAADTLLSGHGARPAEVVRKLARVLDDQVPEPVRLRKPKPGKPAARLVHRRLAEQVAELGRRDAQIRRGEQEGVHKARVACRRLRSLLATCRPLVDREVTDPVRDELRWLTRSLGSARDTTVVRERLAGLLEAESSDLVAGPVGRRIHATGREAPPVPEVMGSVRYFELRHTLDDLVADPPWSEAADRPARDVLPKRVRKDWKRLRKRYDALTDAEDPARRDAALHDVRKAAKRLRYAAETAVPVAGKDAKRLAKAAKDLASHLGQRQDTVVSRERLVELSESAAADGEPTFTYGRLHAREERHAADLDAGLAQVWARIARSGLRSWL